jgi:hypothetical protein
MGNPEIMVALGTTHPEPKQATTKTHKKNTKNTQDPRMMSNTDLT